MRKNKNTIWVTVNKIGIIISIIAGAIGTLWFCLSQYDVITKKQERLVEETIENMIILPVEGSNGIAQFINKNDYAAYILVISADSAYKKHRFTEAETLYYKSYIHYKSKNDDYLANLSFYGIARSKIARAKYAEALDILYKIDTNNYDSLFIREVNMKFISLLCVYAVTLHDNKKAYNYLKKVLTIPPYYECDYFHRGFVFSRLKQYDSAISNYTQTIILDSSLYDAYNNRGNAYLFKKEYLKAIEDFTKLLNVEPKNVEAYNKRGVCYYLTNENSLAIKDFTAAINIDTTDFIAVQNLINIYNKLGNKQKSLYWANKLLNKQKQ